MKAARANGTPKVTLTPKEQAFVDALVQPDFPTIAEAAAVAGYDADYAKHLKNKPHIRLAIAQRVQELREDRSYDIERLLTKMLSRAMRDDVRAEKNGELYLEAVGMLGRGTKIVTSVTQNAGEGSGFSDRLGTLARSRVSADLTRDED